jgi:hypothetical protein
VLVKLISLKPYIRSDGFCAAIAFLNLSRGPLGTMMVVLADAKTSRPRMLSKYERYSIETRPAPPRRKEPRPFNPSVSKIRLAKWLAREALQYRFTLRHDMYRKVLLSRPCIYGVFGGRLGGFHPIRDRCTGCLRCVQEQPEICRVDRNPEFFRFPDPYWVAKDPATAVSSPVATVCYEAATGSIPIKGMGYRGAFAGEGWDSMWTDMSEIVRPTRDGVYGRECISTSVDVGRKPRFLEFNNAKPTTKSRTVQITIPIMFDYLPDGMNSPSIIRSVASAAKRLGTLFIASPEQVRELDPARCTHLAPIVSPLTISQHRDTVLRAPMIELANCDSQFLTQIREINSRAPISVLLPMRNFADRVAVELAKHGVDVIHLSANYHGQSWEPGGGRLAKDFIRSVHQALVRESLRDEVTLIASGGITLAEHVPKAIICGADLVALNTTVLVALQTRFCGECASPDDGRIKPEKFDAKWGEQRLVNLVASWHDQLIEILSAMGMRDARRLRGDIGRAIFNEELEREAFGEILRRT